jgi:uncharacterized protein (DUF1697 family)
MAIYVALLRAVNVGGTGALPMKRLQEICEGLGWRKVRTYIQSGNVVFESGSSENALARNLEAALAKEFGKSASVMIRAAASMEAICQANPFPDAKPSQVGVVFLPGKVPPGFLEGVRITGREEVFPAEREIFVHYPDGMGRSKLKLPKPADTGTVRNFNTVQKLTSMALDAST